ncbi:hypothetical protein BpHYR1_049280 [Brachionus plicatilis]|uniref:Uncharacterized protein n=1 Tax=Brachionus plicatilis TaxID=10195 RepID=A0A3M7S0A2_BRAPC|nr:hypothetical protein BpHYR1_049280 [Brachionus plicatilis]
MAAVVLNSELARYLLLYLTCPSHRSLMFLMHPTSDGLMVRSAALKSEVSKSSMVQILLGEFEVEN